MDEQLIRDCHKAADLIGRADALLICTGAGMGAESRVDESGQWRGIAPPLNLQDSTVLEPACFRDDAGLAWGWWGPTLQRTREVHPHAGYGYLLEIAAQLPRGHFIFTTEVDGLFQRAGFDPARIVESRGSLLHLQCSAPCCQEVWSSAGLEVNVLHHRWQGELPRCIYCEDAVARPNAKLLLDMDWVSRRTDMQRKRMAEWMAKCRAPVTIEIGAGRGVHGVRRFAEQQRGPLIRIHPEQPEVLKPGVAIMASAELAIKTLFNVMAERGFFGQVDEISLWA